MRIDREAALRDAWAVVMPAPRELGLLRGFCENTRVELAEPSYWEVKGGGYKPVVIERVLWQGYILARPPLGMRSSLRRFPHVVDVLGFVLFDTRLREYQAYAEAVTGEEQTRLCRIVKAKAPRTVRSFEELAPVDPDTIEVDTTESTGVLSRIRTDSLATMASYEDYLRTDELADEDQRQCGSDCYRRILRYCNH